VFRFWTYKKFVFRAPQDRTPAPAAGVKVSSRTS
jgi:hypothetical protein